MRGVCGQAAIQDTFSCRSSAARNAGPLSRPEAVEAAGLAQKAELLRDKG